MPVMFEIRELAATDRGYALRTWREEHKKTQPRMPWDAYKFLWGTKFQNFLNDRSSLVLAAYAPDNEVLGFLVASPGKSIDTLHWVAVRFRTLAGAYVRRHGIMTELLRAAKLGDKFIYTLRARKRIDKTLSERLQAAGLGQGVYVPLKEWLK